MNTQDIQKALDWRYATKSFDSSRKISKEDWQILEQSLVKSPSSFGLQPWKFLVVQNMELREKLKPATWGQSQVTDSSHYVVFTTLDKLDLNYVDSYMKRIAEVRGVTLESLQGYRQGIINNLIDGPRAPTVRHWADRQSYIAMGFLMETAALLNIDACPIEGLEPEKYDEILGLKGTGYHTIAAVALGYRNPADKYATAKKVRFPQDKIVQFI